MARKLQKVTDISTEETHGYDAWELSEDSNIIGWYFVPAGISGQDYENALNSAKQKLILLGLTDLEVQALIGRQLF